MKLVAFLSRLATFGLVTFVAGLMFNSQALALFAGTVGAFILLIVAGDYTPHTPHRRRTHGVLVGFRATATATAPSENVAA